MVTIGQPKHGPVPLLFVTLIKILRFIRGYLVNMDVKPTWKITPNRKALIVVGLGVGAMLTRCWLIEYWRRKRLQKMVDDKRRAVNDNIEAMRRRLTSPSVDVQTKRDKIVNLDFETLRLLLSNDTYTPTEVLEAFQWRTLKAHDLTNCVCEFLNEAMIWAQDLERKYYKKDNKPLLYGIPVSVKECNKMKGHHATAGFTQYLSQPADCDSALVVTLKNLGAIPFVLTNVPQSMMSLGCSNPIYGSTTNPFDSSRGPGGSSGGEGALIGLRGSPLGIGTDVGGSVRVPAHFCGIYSLKPTVARMANSGRRGAMPGLTAVQGTAGPMGIDVDSLIWFCRGVWSPLSSNSMFDLNPYVAPLPFNEEVFSNKSKLTIGYYDFDGFLEATPSCRRAVHMAKTALESVGHVVIPFNPLDVDYLYRLYVASLFPDGGQYVTATFRNDLVDPAHKSLLNYLAMPLKRKLIWGRFLSMFYPRAAIPYTCHAQNTSELRRTFELLAAYREKFVTEWFNAGLDCVICPVIATPALPVDVAPNLFHGGWSYCGLYNALDFPSGVLPVTTVNEEDERNLLRYKATDFISHLVKDGATNSIGLPVGVQVVGLPYREEICLRVMKDLDTALKPDKTWDDELKVKSYSAAVKNSNGDQS